MIIREKDHREMEDIMKTRIKNKFGQIFGKLFEIEIEFTDNLPKTNIGKYRYLDQKLNISKYF